MISRQERMARYKEHRRRYSAAPAPDPVGGFFSWLLDDPHWIENHAKGLLDRHLSDLCGTTPRTVRRWGTQFRDIPEHYGRLIQLHQRCLQLELKCAELQQQLSVDRHRVG